MYGVCWYSSTALNYCGCMWFELLVADIRTVYIMFSVASLRQVIIGGQSVKFQRLYIFSLYKFTHILEHYILDIRAL